LHIFSNFIFIIYLFYKNSRKQPFY
jgi:hypothetical protein